MDFLIVVLLVIGLNAQRVADNAATQARQAAAIATTVAAANAKVTAATADLAYQNCQTLSEGRHLSNLRNHNILHFIHFTSRLNPGFDPTDPIAVAYYKEAARLFGPQSDLAPPKCVNPKTAAKKP
jgi:hypothetical protein